MKSLGLIEKLKNSKNKNVFRWIGSKGFSLDKKHNKKSTPLIIESTKTEELLVVRDRSP